MLKMYVMVTRYLGKACTMNNTVNEILQLVVINDHVTSPCLPVKQTSARARPHYQLNRM